MAIYYNYNNVQILVNNQSILADTLSFSASAQLYEKQLIGRRGAFEYVPEKNLDSSVSLTYFLEDLDPLYPFLDSESSMPVEMAGLTLDEGYLTSYAIQATPHGLVNVSADLTFYENFGGSFTPTTLPDKDYHYKQFSDMGITLAGIDATSKITSLNYNVSNSLEPILNVGDLTPTTVRFGVKSTSLSLETYNFEEALTYEGKQVSVEISLGASTYEITGILHSKSIDVQVGQKLISALEILSTAYGGTPTITSATSTVNVGGIFTILGTNLSSVTGVYFNNNIKANEVWLLSDTKVQARVPRFAMSGPYKIITTNGVIEGTSIAINPASQIFIP